MAQGDQNFLKVLKAISKKVNWESPKERRHFIIQIDPLIRNWRGQFPNLRDIFRSEEIDILLKDCINFINPDWGSYRFEQFIRFVINCGYKDEPKVDENGKPSSPRSTAVHLVDRRRPPCWLYRVRELFEIYDRFDVNYTDQLGYTHFHVACVSGCEDVVKKFLELGQNPDCLGYVYSPLYLALANDHSTIAELLLRSGANPNSANAKGSTPLHIIFKTQNYDHAVLEKFFKINKKFNRFVQVDAKDKMGQTPLHLAVNGGLKYATELLLRNGADPNSTNANGLTPLHIIVKRNDYDHDSGLAEIFFKINDDMQQTVLIDTRDKLGNDTPLHLALKCKSNNIKRMTELLLKRGADPNLANVEGFTPLHLICNNDERDKYYNGLVELFFKINSERNKTVQVDVRDKSGRTPLQWAVTNLSPRVIDVLLDHGADLSSFVFPTESHFAESTIFKTWYCKELNLAFGALAVVDSLRKRGYELSRSDALTIMKLFDKYELLEKSADHAKCWYDDMPFAIQARELKMKQDLSLDDLIKLRPKEAAKLFTYADYVKLKCSGVYWDFPRMHRKACVMHLCEQISRGFFRRWALDAFWELTRYRLPILCCEMIIEQLMNQDLYHISLAAGDQSS